MTEQLRLMAVHAHPDDESSKGAATMAKYVDEGVDVLVATCTGGERGSILNPKLQGDTYVEEHIHEVRRKEMDEAREILGVKQSWLGFVDSGLPQGDPLPPLPEGCFGVQDVDEAAGPLVRLIREFRPQVLTTYDENGGYPHPDHIMTHKITMVAFEHAADTEKYPEAEFGPVWQPQKMYYNQGFNRERTVAMHNAMLERGLESPYTEWLKRWEEMGIKAREITTYIPCGEYFEIRDKALIAHATQIDPDGGWFRVPLDVQREVWPTEEYELAKSLVDTSLPEDDLFAGIRQN
ncbi:MULTISPECIES: mycothiol conjugate amidase Mca [unclassified Streptomyces]|uniref:mycothiol conjugate amidase Mca n=1 Tax=unclassified Streptomyces TaxID=2593676 RepID=UPI002DDAEA23|nr:MULTISPECIES: mycothiol conjugate amidase Mca [unclassified Streptomyces]WSA92724.1 mycothiol conjugate amidase Mca [Streptomyces sp. NBC_01795]WSB77095.1 mycothiol conjugate amidase Mca [Streptomyces sp. NBC_01775]WSS14638.1 mycothiol conjugate amidase Mca [Streptomyces sp. NBC_01186]WSS43452.1 mycothiol conjugate amidase Mca [Streptomyces sp. NBC_01187]